MQLDVVKPDDEPYRPAAHCPEHASVDKPNEDPKKPASHREQTLAPTKLYAPGAHMTGVEFVDPSGQL